LRRHPTMIGLILRMVVIHPIRAVNNN
jgi:hypothetical protein